MARLDDWGLVLIHGLPERGHDHRLQLAAVERIAAACSIESFFFDWWPYAGELQTYRLLRSGDFGGSLAPRFDDWLHSSPIATVRDRKLVVVAYSLGGLIFYNWIVAAAARGSQPMDIRQAITVAAPFQFSAGSVELQRSDGAWTTLTGLARQRIEPAAIATALRRRLLVIQAEGDRTIMQSDSDIGSPIRVPQRTISLPPLGAVHNAHRQIPFDGQALLLVAAAMARHMAPALPRSS
ncbi:MAG: hypothetical protein ACYDCQ_01735 [Dehalococcoidia bacterium]